jgi:hypothetical protein
MRWVEAGPLSVEGAFSSTAPRDWCTHRQCIHTSKLDVLHNAVPDLVAAGAAEGGGVRVVRGGLVHAVGWGSVTRGANPNTYIPCCRRRAAMLRAPGLAGVRDMVNRLTPKCFVLCSFGEPQTTDARMHGCTDAPEHGLSMVR